MKKSVLSAFIVFWVLNTLLLYFATQMYPTYFMLGTYRMSSWLSAFMAGFVWTAFVWFASPFVSKFAKLKGEALMFGFYFLANFLGLWLTARLAPVSGFGSTSFVWVVSLALVANTLQYFVWKTGNFNKLK